MRQMNFNVAGADSEKTEKTPIADSQWQSEKLRKLSEITDDNEKMKIAERRIAVCKQTFLEESTVHRVKLIHTIN